jgi:uncharacterized membrane protein
MLARTLLLALLLAIALLPPTAAEAENKARVQGVAYDWFTFEPMENVDVKLLQNSFIVERVMSENGEYSFEVPPGEYTVVASYYLKGTLLYQDNQRVKAVAGEVHEVDLILFPVLEEENELPEDIVPEIGEEVGANLWPAVGLLFAVATVAAVIGYYAIRYRPREILAKPVKVVGIPEDLQEILRIIRGSGGRIKQADLRRKLPYSEAKVSLMLADLESRGLIRKIKRGRGNIIVLTELG